MRISRRVFVGSLAAAAAARVGHAQEPSPWKAPVLDGHLHLRREVAANLTHMDGCGVTKAIILARDTAADQIAHQIDAARKQSAARLVWASSTDITTPGAEARLTEAVKKGALGFAEMKFRVAADSAEFQRIYALAGELGVPIMIHFQEVPHFEGEGVFATGFKQFETMLKKYPQTRFVGHADAFWANLDAKYANEAAYPGGPITRGGVTDKLLGDYANLFGDLSANSGNNGLSRDPQFTPDFLRRHQDKLIFGSDCSCADGKGSGVAQANNPAAARLAGKCVARATLTLLQSSTSPEIFRKLVWENGHRVYKISV
jgi:predicted TIM-barrel fold metal-dependent hydrolase